LTHPHNLAREYFLEHKEYTHLIVQPQDLHATKEHYENLIKTVQDTNYDVVSCVCNVERPGHRLNNVWAICKKIPSRDKHKRYYNWIPQTSSKMGILRVEFQGMVFCSISRKVVQRLMIDGEYVFKGANHANTNRFGMAPDLTFAHCCKDLGIPMYANTDIRLIHYANHKPNLVGKKISSTEFIKWDGSKD